jgi:hypothetical protein
VFAANDGGAERPRDLSRLSAACLAGGRQECARNRASTHGDPVNRFPEGALPALPVAGRAFFFTIGETIDE